MEKMLINEKLENLKKYYNYLRNYQGCSIQELKNNPTLQGAVRYYLQVACECIIDISEIIISALGLPRPDTARDSILTLSKEGIVPEDFGVKISKMAGLRNILVHEYAAVDIDRIFHILHEDIDDFSKFAQYIADWLKKFKPA